MKGIISELMERLKEREIKCEIFTLLSFIIKRN